MPTTKTPTPVTAQTKKKKPPTPAKSGLSPVGAYRQATKKAASDIEKFNKGILFD